MMMNADERTMRFVRMVEQMQACEMIDMDYSVKRSTDDYGVITYAMEIPDKDVLALVKRPSVMKMSRPQAEQPAEAADKDEENREKWRAMMGRLRGFQQE